MRTPRCFSYTQPFRRTAVCAQVDDLKDIGSLEEYSQRSQVILFFLSCGYFRSKARSRRPVPRSGSSGSQRTRVCCDPRHSPRLTARLLACHQNCLREIRSSLEQSKPIVLVQEADPAKGGATLQALREDMCPVGHVVSFELPPTLTEYADRLACTARGGHTGRMSVLVTDATPREHLEGLAEVLVATGNEVPRWLEGMASVKWGKGEERSSL